MTVIFNVSSFKINTKKPYVQYVSNLFSLFGHSALKWRLIFDLIHRAAMKYENWLSIGISVCFIRPIEPIQ